MTWAVLKGYFIIWYWFDSINYFDRLWEAGKLYEDQTAVYCFIIMLFFQTAHPLLLVPLQIPWYLHQMRLTWRMRGHRQEMLSLVCFHSVVFSIYCLVETSH